MKLFTIGGYGHTEESFLKTLKSNGIDLFVDIRQRRGMRGKAYAFLNAKKLEENLRSAGISYLHFKDLAPTNEVRSFQKTADIAASSSKRERDKLSSAFIEAYKRGILSGKEREEILGRVSEYRNICFFCVEKGHEACHRSVLTDWLEPIAGAATHI
ncbi:DUF488 domain-containing protein [Cereibacter sphaeroides]|uniref:DUF488 domain-containing protein n=1 Tax=Cereibacter sphaeroides TaxID=1063 RepID=UPI000F542B5C|nr:DUF488 domain-containing protein [Cereibacter sphaeroides]AZB56131.1 DUF488 domain-containing protein [Cereibacter sphaeroides]AZB60833.1 DUF488 domain-containing protein [Cereibacter sphaeroides]